MTLFEDHLVRDINAGRFANNTSLVLVTHGLALRVFLMRWFHRTVEQFMSVVGGLVCSSLTAWHPGGMQQPTAVGDGQPPQK